MNSSCGLCEVVNTPLTEEKPFNLATCRGMKIFVASSKQLKKDAAQEAIQGLAQWHLQPKNLEVLGFSAESNIKEQPHGRKMTIQGAQNRITNLHRLVLEKDSEDPETVKDNVLRFYVSMENGIIKERVKELKNRDIFETENGKVWVDRCYIICEIYYNAEKKTVKGFSDGVMVPLLHVEESASTDWNVTAGDFIAKKYDTNATDWHEKLAGVSRRDLIMNGIEGVFKNAGKILDRY